MTAGYVTIKKAMEYQSERDDWRKRAEAAERERDELQSSVKVYRNLYKQALGLGVGASLSAHDAAIMRRQGELAAASIEDGELLDRSQVFDLFCERANRIERGES